jgi:glucose-1-phosphate cytidylyltransferase|tara:strand:+ start:113 stop:871 length:759 start_codon:yes stop_codon:yes gene_type:complete
MKLQENFYAIILIGGMGSRFSKINQPPKQLIKLNKRSLLENLIISFVKNGINNFVLPLGYKKKYFIDFLERKKKIFKKKVVLHRSTNKEINVNNINIFLFDAGIRSSKLLRIKQSLRYINEENFFVTYGDGIANIELNKYLKIFKKKNKAIIASKYINSQYGHFKTIRGKLLKFEEKPILKNPINIGYYFFTKEIFKNFYKDNYELENQFINKMIKDDKLFIFTHKGFFFNIDRKIDLINIKKNYKKILLKL